MRSHPPLCVRRKPKAKNPTPFEATDQARVCKYSREKNWVFYAIPNDGKRSPAAARKAAATGLQKGMLDLAYPIPRKGFHGLFIEMKRLRGGVVSEWQKYWIDVLRYFGYRVEVCYGYNAAIAVLEDYFG